MSHDRRTLYETFAAINGGLRELLWWQFRLRLRYISQFKNIKALAFDFYRNRARRLFGDRSDGCEQLFPAKGNQLAQIWRTKQLIYILDAQLDGTASRIFPRHGGCPRVPLIPSSWTLQPKRKNSSWTLSSSANRHSPTSKPGFGSN